MMCEASHDAITDAGIGERKIDAVYVANMGAARNNRRPASPARWSTT